jgi:inosine/xanthosine triphosphatase
MNSNPLFAVGSKNPIKIACVLDAAREYWPGAQAVGVIAESGVSNQPVTDHETFTGALNRARLALARTPEADFGVGVEGGIVDDDDGMWTYAWVVIVDREDRVGKGQSGRFELPAGVIALVRSGMELGHADDQFFGRENSKQQEGAIGILSDGRITRLTLYKPAVTFALLRFLHPEYYDQLNR